MRKAHEYYLQAMVNKKTKEDKETLDFLTLLQHFGGWEEYGYTKQDLDNQIKNLQKYTY